jgi:hypothetical protein
MAILYAFDLIEHYGEDLRELPFLDRKAALARHQGAGILLNEQVAEAGPTVFEHACRLGARPARSRQYLGQAPVRPNASGTKIRQQAA